MKRVEGRRRYRDKASKHRIEQNRIYFFSFPTTQFISITQLFLRQYIGAQLHTAPVGDADRTCSTDKNFQIIFRGFIFLVRHANKPIRQQSGMLRCADIFWRIIRQMYLFFVLLIKKLPIIFGLNQAETEEKMTAKLENKQISIVRVPD